MTLEQLLQSNKMDAIHKAEIQRTLKDLSSDDYDN